MITDADIKKMKVVFVTKDDIEKMKAVFATKEDLEKLSDKFETKFATKDEMSSGFRELVKFIGEIRNEIVGLLSKQIEELKDVVRRHQMTLENHDSRIGHLEYANKT